MTDIPVEYALFLVKVRSDQAQDFLDLLRTFIPTEGAGDMQTLIDRWKSAPYN